MRTEKDKFGEMQLEDEKLCGIQTARAAGKFFLEYKKTDLRLVYAIVTVKKLPR